MLTFLYNYFFGASSVENQTKIDDMSRDELVNFLKDKKFTKLNINNVNYSKILSSLNIYQDDLLLFEYELYNQLNNLLGEYENINKNKNILTKKKFYVNPKFG